MTWRHYQYGLRYLARWHVRQLLLLADGHRIGATVEESYKVIAGDLRKLTQVPRVP